MERSESSAAQPHGKDCPVCENRRELKRLEEGMEPYTPSAAHPSDHTGFGDCGCDVCCPEPGPQEEIAKLKHAISGLIPWVAGSGRGAAQESLAEACELIGADPFMWSAHPDVLLRRRPDLERRKP